MDEKINEVVNQIPLPPIPFDARHIIFEPKEVGDYSIYIEKNLDEILQIGILGDGKWYVSKEILSSSEGSIVYFDRKIIPDIKVGHFYDGWIRRHYIKIAESLYKAGIIPLEQLLDLYKIIPFRQK